MERPHGASIHKAFKSELIRQFSETAKIAQDRKDVSANNMALLAFKLPGHAIQSVVLPIHRGLPSTTYPSQWLLFDNRALGNIFRIV
jgi:hypothetical protein